MKLFNLLEINLVRKNKENEEPPVETAQDFLGVDDIKNGVIKHKEGYYSLVIEVAPINYGLLSDVEQNQVEDAFTEFLNSLNYPIQLYVQTRYLDVSSHLQFLRSKSENSEGPMKEYIANLHDYMLDKLAQRPVLVKRYFAVVSCKIKNPNESMEELEHRVNYVIDGLYSCGKLNAHPLSTEEVAELIYVAQNKKRAWISSVTDSAKHGHKALYTAADGG